MQSELGTVSASPFVPKGRFVALGGPVVDIQFAVEDLPPVNDALHIDAGSARKLLAEPKSHINEHPVPAVTLQTANGFNRGAATMIAVRDAVLGRVLAITSMWTMGRLSACPIAESKSRSSDQGGRSIS